MAIVKHQLNNGTKGKSKFLYILKIFSWQGVKKYTQKAWKHKCVPVIFLPYKIFFPAFLISKNKKKTKNENKIRIPLNSF